MRSHCRNGHAMTPANTYHRPTGYADCKTCRDTEPSRYIFKGGLGLPEKVEYRDTGCNLRPACLSCDLARCQFDEPASEPHWKNKYEQLQRDSHLLLAAIITQAGGKVSIPRNLLTTLDRDVEIESFEDMATRSTIYKTTRKMPVMRENQHE